MFEEKLRSLNIELPIAPKAAGSYIPVVFTQNLAFVSGQIPLLDGKVIYTGKVSESNLDEAQKSARLCALNILAQLKKELSTLDKISKIVKLTGFVNCSPDFYQQPTVINAASDLFFEIFGEKGHHSRVAVGAPSLPLNSMTEIAAIVEIQ